MDKFIEIKLKELKELDTKKIDTEMVHIEADEILCEILSYLGHNDVVIAFNSLYKWYA